MHLSIVLNTPGPTPSWGEDVHTWFLGREVLWKCESINMDATRSPWRQKTRYGDNLFWGMWDNANVVPKPSFPGGLNWCMANGGGVVHITPTKAHESDVFRQIERWLPVWALVKGSGNDGPWLSLHDWDDGTDFDEGHLIPGPGWHDTFLEFDPQGPAYTAMAGGSPVVVRRGYRMPIPKGWLLDWVHQRYYALLIYNPGDTVAWVGQHSIEPRCSCVFDVTPFNEKQFAEVM